MPMLPSWKRAWGAETPECVWIEVVGSINLVFRLMLLGLGSRVAGVQGWRQQS